MVENLDEFDNPLENLDFPPEVADEMRGLLTRIGAEFWARDEGIEMSTRSLVTMAILCTRGQQEELAIHVRMGQEAFGVTREQICETIRHCALYAGAPMAVAGFRTVARVFAEMDREA